MAKGREHWTGRTGFILATIASAVGLGSIWKFPYELGANGGGAFLLFYLLGLGLVVAPLMLVEMAIGRRGSSDAIESVARIARAAGASQRWRAVAALGIVTSCVILSYYSVIGGWAIAYAVDPDAASTGDMATMKSRFDNLLAQPVRVAALHGLFMLIIGLIVGRGISAGIEAAVRIIMPVMTLLIVVLAGYSLVTGDTAKALSFLFMPDFARFSARAALEAVGLGFFSIGVGYAILITYAAYADRRIDLVEASVAAMVGDTLISLLAGLAVFPLVFAHGLDPASGPGLVFVTLPLAFSAIPYGNVVSLAFFVCLALAAIASAISMLEMPVAYLRRVLGWSRPRATLMAAAACWVGGLATVMSFGPWHDWRPLAGIGVLAGESLYDLIDGVASNVMLPMAGLGLALFAGWTMPRSTLAEELGLSRRTSASLAIVLRYVVPASIVAVTLGPLFDGAR